MWATDDQQEGWLYRGGLAGHAVVVAGLMAAAVVPGPIGRALSWEPLRPELVVQVAYDHMQGQRFRHTAQFRRWRTDKAPRGCTYAQLEVVAPEELAKLFAGGR